MASAHEIAANLLSVFGQNVVARRPPMTYGQYATAIDKAPAEYGLAVGKAMHAIGALCVLRQLPVAPLYWVRNANDEPRGIFESDPLERHYIVESKDIDIMYVVAREYTYSAEEFTGLEEALRKSLANGHVSGWSPHEIWHLTFSKHPKESPTTYYERAMARYRGLFVQIKAEKGVKK